MRNVILAAVGACFLLIGCGGGRSPSAASSSIPDPAPSNTGPMTVSSPTPTPSPTATTPLLTGAAVKPGEVPPTLDPHFITHDSGGAIAFAGYFYRALDWSIATTNANLLRSISSPDCNQCQQYIREIDAFAATGGHSEGGRLIAFAFAPAHGDLTKSDFVIQVMANQEPEVFVDTVGGRTTPAPPPNPATNYLYMTWDNGAFQAVGIG